jgi:hypothetical protein
MLRNSCFACYVAALAFAMTVSLSATPQTSAALVSDLVTFSATNFFSDFGQPAPVDPVQGSFTITFDPTQTYTNSTTGITLKSLNIALDSAVGFDYPVPSNPPDTLAIGGIANGVNSVQILPSSNDFELTIFNFTTSPTFGSLDYSQTAAGTDSGFSSNDGSVTVTPLTSTATPEPSTWLLIGSGLGGLAVLRKKCAGS